MKTAEELYNWIKEAQIDNIDESRIIEEIDMSVDEYASLREKETFKAGFISGGSGWRSAWHAEEEWERHYDNWKLKHKEG